MIQSADTSARIQSGSGGGSSGVGRGGAGNASYGRYLGYLRQHGLPLSEANFSCYADHSVPHWALVRQGMGIGVVGDDMVHDIPGLIRVLDDVPPVRFPIWLVTHRELRTSRRIRVVFEALAQGLV